MPANASYGPEKYRVCLWHADPNVLAEASTVLAQSNFDVAASGRRGVDLIDWVCSNPVDLIVTGNRLEGIDGVEALLNIADCKPVPSLMILRGETLAAVEQVLSDHVMSFLTEPLRAAELVPNAILTLRRFFEIQSLRGELSAARSHLADAKVCYLAKCHLMREHDLTEPEAHQRLQRMATDGRIRLAAAAKRVLDGARDPKRQSISHAS